PDRIFLLYCYQLTRACRVSSARQGKSAMLISQLALAYLLYRFFLLLRHLQYAKSADFFQKSVRPDAVRIMRVSAHQRLFLINRK
ncbi:MAG TPA: hypothetical protein H9926_04510, partial [Candidatus Eisenbergiella intestinigallinarum]|nr:hypothetical protein [Candidatus Eisenbergiella intestinigallinarum]